ncbi:hypothetical protein SJ05684_c30140 [Sinorhizobium sojae CCBAU 05684]|uniref:DUF551 domain-containing protein n=1 Tax=Sinorhizobium sojae CCBAU 05684 TaxID=716928 RepID=A0A249PET7_9HYPH|nr:DUF551 domain-containing protein [Sinorhizobium sojae]ASY64438.1 hypothetical protein SJ05684_c30140 [Sinorhizobium sojae CCBAU 05684]
MTDRTASPTTVAFRALPADIQALSFDAVGHLPRPMSHMEMLLAVGQAVLAERERDKWRPIDSAPKDRTPVIIAVPTKDRDDYIVGEAYFHPEDNDWWWANNAPGDYHGGPISDINHHGPTHWRPLPEPPTLRADPEQGEAE